MLSRALVRAPLRAGNPAARQILLRRNYASQAGSTFTKEREAVKAHAAQSSELWRKLSLYVAIPALILSSINAYNLWNEHWEHESHLPPQEERPQYPYLNIRVKRYPWGDGDKTLFWNDNVNYKKTDE
ncbi:Cytochrome c oxidase subunit 6A, mitochondrial [Arthrobotrys conoides]|uniref:Cytochrome c oxidase subunit n=1 Tax=Arthrobotrys conoides TaxID=74498 RepID=A0AAN8RQR8_9PEZI